MRTSALTAAALLAFASNSILCRLALGESTIDAASFTSIRLASGAAVLATIASLAGPNGTRVQGSWGSALMLVAYAVPFSFAYNLLTTGTGALILFGAVQVTMMLAALAGGERPGVRQWLGLAVAVAGLVYLVLPGLAAPPPLGAGLMATAGVAWGLYSLRGRGVRDPVAHNAGNFARGVPMALAVSMASLPYRHIEVEGMALAVASGAIASGLGYVAWYAALRGLTATRASLVQLPVPVLTAIGGVLILAEPVSLRLAVSTASVLGGIALALAAADDQPVRSKAVEAGS